MVDVFEEVEEELRSERWKRLARKYGPWVAGALVLALVVALAFWGYDSWRTRQAETASVAYDRGMQALSQGDNAAADTAFTEAAEAGSAGYESLALQQRAGIALSADRTDEAIALFDQAADATGDAILGDAAALKAAYLVMDTGSTADAIGRLEPLAEEGRPYRPFAQEALALTRILANQADQARELFVLLSLGQDVPDSVRQRAQAAIESIDAGTAQALAATVRAQSALPRQGPQSASEVAIAQGQAQSQAQGQPAPQAPSSNPAE